MTMSKQIIFVMMTICFRQEGKYSWLGLLDCDQRWRGRHGRWKGEGWWVKTVNEISLRGMELEVGREHVCMRVWGKLRESWVYCKEWGKWHTGRWENGSQAADTLARKLYALGKSVIATCLSFFSWKSRTKVVFISIVLSSHLTIDFFESGYKTWVQINVQIIFIVFNWGDSY